MNMKKHLWILVAVLSVVACGNKETPSENTLAVSPATLSFSGNEAAPKSVQVTTSGSWAVSATENWLHVAPSSGNGNGVISVSVDANGPDPREGKLKITSGSLSKEVSVSQGAGEKKEPKAIVPQPHLDGEKRASTTYQLLIYSFADSDGDGIGDFKGIQEKLPYLESLGITALWLSPAHPTSTYHAYDVNDYFSLNPLYAVGSHTVEKAEADFKDLLDAAHARGIKIYMDYVLNHSGTGTEWFQSVKTDPKNSPYKDYYVLSSEYYPEEAIGGMGIWHSLGGGDIGYKGRLHFKVDWTGSTKYVTVTQTTEDAQESNKSGAKRWIHVGPFSESQGMYETSTNIFEITLDVDTSWGFLVRTSNTTWDGGTKYGGKAGQSMITLGQPFPLDNSTAADIVFGEAYSYFAAFDGSMPDLNYGDPDTCENSRAFQSTVESATKWVNMGVDGFRLDAVVWIYGASTSANVKFLDKWYKAVNAAYKSNGHSDDIFMVGEAWHGGHAEEQQYYAGLPSCFEFDFWWAALQPAVNSGNGSDYASKVIGYINDHSAQRVSEPAAITSFFMTNHDKSSIKAKQNPYKKEEWLNFYRAADDLGRNIAKEKQACAMLLTTQGKPFVYQGEELGYWRVDDNDKLDDEYLRAPIVWDASATQIAKKGVNNKVDNNMLTGAISVATQESDAASLLNVYKTWGQLRNGYPALATGAMTKSSLSGNSIASWYMTAGSQKLLVIHNVSSIEAKLTVNDSMDKPIALLGTGTVKDKTLTLGGNSSVVFEL